MTQLVSFVFLAVSVACAVAKSPYIKGGHDAALGAWPWQGSIQYMFGNLHECGAAIISDSFILTASHCVENSPFARHLVAGLYNTKDWTQGRPEEYHFYSVNWHPDHDGRNNDIAVIELHAPVLNMSNPYIDKVTMAPEDANYDGRSCYVTGWGATQPGSVDIAGPLQEAEVEVMTNEECKTQWGDTITDGMICVGGGGNIGACAGDSGSPLVCEGDNGWELAGIASFGPENCDASKPSVFSRVSFYREWIRSETGF